MSGNVRGVELQNIPPAGAMFFTPSGNVNPVWYRFFYVIWQKVSSGSTNDITLETTNAIAGQASTDATTAAADASAALNAVSTETARATVAEGILRTQINATNAQIATINTTLGSLQTQINTINARLTAAGIP